jgi:hypothetical protein
MTVLLERPVTAPPASPLYALAANAGRAAGRAADAGDASAAMFLRSLTGVDPEQTAGFVDGVGSVRVPSQGWPPIGVTA